MVFIRAVILSAESAFFSLIEIGPATVFAALVAYFLTVHVGLYAWQLTGLVRACDRYQSAFGSVAVTWAIYFGIAVSLIFTGAIAFSSAQTVLISGVTKEKARAEQILMQATTFALDLGAGGKVVFLVGEIDHGITKSLEALIDKNPDVTGIVLQSPGGTPFEGRGVARVIQHHGLNTHVAADCFSACALAFIAGETRTLGPDGRLGFHGYGLEGRYQVPFADIAREQEIDRRAFELRGVRSNFLAKVFTSPISEMWLPSATELLEAGVVHSVLDPRFTR